MRKQTLPAAAAIIVLLATMANAQCSGSPTTAPCTQWDSDQSSCQAYANHNGQCAWTTHTNYCSNTPGPAWGCGSYTTLGDCGLYSSHYGNCYWVGGSSANICMGTLTCTSQLDLTACNSIIGCTWVATTYTCDGTLTCPQQWGAGCTAIPGCTWTEPPQSETLHLDFGNDTDIEWISPVGFEGPATLDVGGYVNRYVRGGCWCIGCVRDAATGNCTVPIVLSSDNEGNLTVNDVKLTFQKFKTLGEVGYGEPFRKSEGGCWSIDYIGGTTPQLPVPPEYLKATGGCLAPGAVSYAYPGTGPITTDDAINDAMYRLLNGTLDNETVPNGVINIVYNNNMSFQADGQIGVQSLWGPLKMRLVVWA